MLRVAIHEPVRTLIRQWPTDVKRELGSVLTRIQNLEYVGMPDVRAMPSVGKGICEIRIRATSGTFRVFYLVARKRVVVFHAFIKKARSTPQKEIRTATLRLKMIVGDMGERDSEN